MAAKKDPAKLVRQARYLIEEFNRVVLDDAKDLSAAALSGTIQALKSLVERGDVKTEVATTAAELRTVAADSEQLGKSLANPASALFLMGGR
ncbi:hypothetical protein [Streptomyces qinglanensis]|uniref:hypothetical protein n=1 Tax=Streptomyces qinglanensis TaxID=943816 RepID=UPI003D75ABDF